MENICMNLTKFLRQQVIKFLWINSELKQPTTQMHYDRTEQESRKVQACPSQHTSKMISVLSHISFWECEVYFTFDIVQNILWDFMRSNTCVQDFLQTY